MLKNRLFILTVQETKERFFCQVLGNLLCILFFIASSYGPIVFKQIDFVDRFYVVAFVT